jgi:hypothetical protein
MRKRDEFPKSIDEAVAKLKYDVVERIEETASVEQIRKTIQDFNYSSNRKTTNSNNEISNSKPLRTFLCAITS